MTSPMPVGLTPYVSPALLLSAPTGVDFSTLGPTTGPVLPPPAANNAEVWNVCHRATSMADQYCNQVLRATVDTEILHGPDFRVVVGPAAGGATPTPYWGDAGYNARLIMSRWPILQVNTVRTAVNGVWPRQWQTVPTGFYEPEYPPFGIFNSVAPADDAYGGQGILVAPGFISRCYGRNGFAVQVTYTNGWPHASLTLNATAGSTSVAVSDCTGWAVSNYDGTVTGATGVIYDSGQQEVVTCTSASTMQGPGTLTLAAGTVYAHEGGTIISSLPAAVQQACVLFAAAQALTRGATSTTIHSVGGGAAGAEQDIMQLNSEAELLLHPFRRVLLCPLTVVRFTWHECICII